MPGSQHPLLRLSLTWVYRVPGGTRWSCSPMNVAELRGIPSAAAHYDDGERGIVSCRTRGRVRRDMRCRGKVTEPAAQTYAGAYERPIK